MLTQEVKEKIIVFYTLGRLYGSLYIKDKSLIVFKNKKDIEENLDTSQEYVFLLREENRLRITCCFEKEEMVFYYDGAYFSLDFYGSNEVPNYSKNNLLKAYKKIS